MKPFIIWAFVKWCLSNIFGGLINRHYVFVKTMRREPALAVLLSILFGLLTIGATMIISLAVGPDDTKAARELSALVGFITALCVVGYTTAIAVMAAWRSFVDDRNELFETLKR